jgi:hypothetical protein
MARDLAADLERAIMNGHVAENSADDQLAPGTHVRELLGTVMGALAYYDVKPREPHPTGPRLADADLCARCGNQFPNGQLCDPCKIKTDFNGLDHKQLAKALDGQWVYAKNRDGTHHAQVADADDVARELMEKLAEQQAQESDPWAGEPDPPEVHIHCEHAPGSRAAYELGHADQIVEMLGRLPERHVKRVLRWAWDYLTDGDEPPF